MPLIHKLSLNGSAAQAVAYLQCTLHPFGVHFAGSGAAFYGDLACILQEIRVHFPGARGHLPEAAK